MLAKSSGEPIFPTFLQMYMFLCEYCKACLHKEGLMKWIGNDKMREKAGNPR